VVNDPQPPVSREQATGDPAALGPNARALERQAARLLAAGSQDWINVLDRDAFPRFIVRARGPYVWDADGRRFVDLYSGSGAIILGHSDAHQMAAVRAHLDDGAPVLSFRHPVELEVAAVLRRLLPSAERCAFFKTGSEAANAALRVAMLQVERPVALSLGYHGWLSPYEEGWPAAQSVRVEACAWDLDALVRTLRTRASEIGVVIVSPDASMLAREFYVTLEAETHRIGALFVMDEIKSGFRARFPCLSGAYGLDPDLVLLSKALANGFPVSVLAGKASLLDDQELFSLFSTFAAESLSLAAARATLELLENGAYMAFEAASSHVYSQLSERLRAPSYTLAGIPTFFRLQFHERHVAREFARRLAGRGILYHPFDYILLSRAHEEPGLLDRIVDTFVHVLRELALPQ
jgi:glutamate-1-semialdehyde aminotransferase